MSNTGCGNVSYDISLRKNCCFSCEERLAASQSEVERLRQSNVELQQDMTSCREREAELLEFTQKLTEKNVRLQSEFSATEAKV